VNGEGASLLDVWFAAARWGWYAALFLVLGAGTYAPSLFGARTALDAAEPDLARRISTRAARTGLLASLALVVLTLLRLRLQLQTFLEPGEPLTWELVTATMGTTWGTGWLGQAALALLAIPAFALARRGSRGGWTLAHATGGGLGLVAGATGHAVTQVGGRFGFLLDAAHVWAGGLWLGGLALLLGSALPATRALAPDARRPVIRALVADFSRRALVVAPAAVLLGGWLAVSYLGWRWPLELTQSSYGRLLGLKLLALVGVGLLGAWNWRVVQPGLARGDAERRLFRSGAMELLFGALLLAATAVLVATALPGEEM
jgi:putative copper resistance protein D